MLRAQQGMLLLDPSILVWLWYVLYVLQLPVGHWPTCSSKVTYIVFRSSVFIFPGWKLDIGYIYLHMYCWTLSRTRIRDGLKLSARRILCRPGNSRLYSLEFHRITYAADTAVSWPKETSARNVRAHVEKRMSRVGYWPGYCSSYPRLRIWCNVNQQLTADGAWCGSYMYVGPMQTTLKMKPINGRRNWRCCHDLLTTPWQRTYM
jgi:hypothetical protein